MAVRVKICGITTPGAMEAAAGADWIGFAFVAASPRAIAPEHAAELSRNGPPGPGRVGLFLDPSDDEVEAVLSRIALAALQVYAGPERVQALRARFGVPVWRGVAVADRSDLPAPGAASYPDAFLLDAKVSGGTLPGGNAAAVDWPMLAGWDAPAPWLLAGGLTPGNVARAVAASGAGAVDVSSGVESSRGVKDPALIRAFLSAAQAG